jgi:hypothetical protein
VDSIEHYLLHCENTHIFWRQVFNWGATNLKVWLQVDTYEVLFGIPNENNEPIINQINFIILYGKYYINRCKKTETKMHLYEFLLECKKQMMLKHELETSAGEHELELNLSKGSKNMIKNGVSCTSVCVTKHRPNIKLTNLVVSSTLLRILQNTYPTKRLYNSRNHAQIGYSVLGYI